jgi:hypothetical protein
MVRLLAFLANVRLKSAEVIGMTNALAYYGTELITAKESFMIQALSAVFTTLFSLLLKNGSNKLECLFLASTYNPVYFLRVSSEPT